MTAAQPIARPARRGPRHRACVQALIERCARTGGTERDATTGARLPTDHRLRHGRLAGPDRRRVHVRQRPPLRRRRRPRTSPSGASRRRAWSSPTTAGSPRSTSRPAAAEVLLAHDIPVAFAVARRADPDELVRGRPARRRGRHRHHRQPQPVGRQRVQGQGPDRRRRRAPTSSPASRPGSRVNGGDRDRPAAVRRRRGGRPGRAVRPVRRLRARSSAGRSTSMRCGRPTSASSSTRCRAPARGWISRLLAGGRIRVTEIHQERNPYFGGVNPEPIRPNVDEALGLIAGGGYDLGLLLDGDADRAGRGRRAGDVHPPAPGHRPADVLPRRAPRLARPGRRQSSTTRRWRRGSASATASRRHETPVGFKFIGPKMIETGAMMGAEESGGFGFGMHLPERDGIYADLLLLDLFLREQAAGRWPVSTAIAALPRARRAVVLPAHRRPRRPRRSTRRRSAACSSTCAAAADRRSPAQPVARTVALDTERRLQVLPRRRLVAARPGVGHRAARPRLHGGDLGRAARRAGRSPASSWCAAHDRRRRAGASAASTSRGATS